MGMLHPGQKGTRARKDVFGNQLTFSPK